MKLNFKKKSLILIPLLFCFNIYTLPLLDAAYFVTTAIDTAALNRTIETASEKIAFSTVTHEDHVMLTQIYQNYETGEYTQSINRLNFDSASNLNYSNFFDCQLPTYSDFPQSINIDKDIADYF